MSSHKGKVRFNVGGEIFETMEKTISNAGPNSFMSVMLHDVWLVQYEEFGEHFIDRDPACFRILLNLLRTSQLFVPPTVPETLLFQEAHYYGLLDHVRSAKQVELDDLKLASSITGRASLKSNALIRASPNGGCSVAKGRVFHVYDWMLRQLPTANLDYMKIVVMEWCDSQNILISGRKRSTNNGGGIGLFNPQTAELKHKFKLTQTSSSSPNRSSDGDNQFSEVLPRNLAIDSNNKMFYCCCKNVSFGKERSGTGAWDITTGQQICFLEGVRGKSELGDALKLQWMRSRNCLMAAISSHQGNKISILDQRVKDMHLGGWRHGSFKLKHGVPMTDAVGIEERDCVSVINESADFGFVDLRRLGSEGEFPSPREKVHFLTGGAEKPKLGCHGRKLFCSTENFIYVYCGFGSIRELTCQVKPKHGGGCIYDFSIRRDRLFSLQADPKDFDNCYEINVLETLLQRHRKAERPTSSPDGFSFERRER